MKIIMSVLAVIIVLVIAFVTIVIANEGEDKVVDEYLASQQTPSPPVNISPDPSAESPTPSVEPIYTGPVNPLTGLPAETEIAVNRPYAIMINNIKTAQPQIGISKADIIYEILVEGGITRMMAVYQDVAGAGEIGSIRSARPYFVDIAFGLDALYIHAGGSNDAYGKLYATNIFHLDGVNGNKQDIFFRDPVRKKNMGLVHSLVTTDELILKFVPTYKVNTEHQPGYACNMTFSDAVAAGSLAATRVTAHFSSSKTTTFTYSADSGAYDITQYGSAYIDGNDQSKISVSNVLILRTSINVISGDEEGRIDVDVTGGGTGIFCCNGKYEEITWSRTKSANQFTFTREDGTALVFARGKTYISIISNKDKIDFVS